MKPRHAKQRSRARHARRQQGTVYLLVLSVTTMLVAIGVTAAMIGRVDLQAERLEADQAQAANLALHAIQLVRRSLEDDATWRQTHSNNAWSDPIDVDDASFRYKLVDTQDADLENDATAPVQLTVEATVGQAVRLYSITLRDGKVMNETFSVLDSKDDSVQSLLGVCNTSLDYARAGEEGLVTSIAGVRFDKLPIEPGETIHTAAIQFTAYDANTDATTLTLTAQAHDDAPDFGGSLYDISSRSRTTHATSWSPAGWATGDAGAEQRTPDLSKLVQEIIDRPGWQADKAIVFILEGTQARDFRTYDYSPAHAPRLLLTYTAPGLTADYTTLRRELQP